MKEIHGESEKLKKINGILIVDSLQTDNRGTELLEFSSALLPTHQHSALKEDENA